MSNQPHAAQGARRIDGRAAPSPFNSRNRLGRMLWGWVWWVLFRPSPPRFFGWRRFLLRRFGAELHESAFIHPTVRIWAPWNLEMHAASTLGPGVECYSMDRITIGEQVTVSQRAHLCTGSHDITDVQMRLITAPIMIKAESWVCAEVFIGPGVTIGCGAVVAARAVVVKDIEPWTVVGGNPARFIKPRVLRKS